MFKGSKNVEPGGAHVVHRERRRPEQRLHRPRTRRCSGRPCRSSTCRWCCGSKPTAWRRCDVDEDELQDRARGREGRAPDARRESAVRPAHRDHLRQGVHDASRTSTRRSAAWRISRPRRSRTCATSTTRTTCPNNATLTIVGDFDPAQAHAARRSSTSAGCRSRPSRCRATFPAEPPQTHENGASRSQEPWPLPAVVVAYHITYDGHPDSYPLHMASKILSDGESSRIYREAGVREADGAGGLRRRQHHRAPESVLRGGHRPARAVARPTRAGADRRARPAAAPSR